MSKAWTYGPLCQVTEVPGAEVASVETNGHVIGQLSTLPPHTHEDGFLIRVWPPNGTHEQGGNNLTCLSLVISFDADGKAMLDKIDYWPDAHEFNPTKETT
jgi:hypothetical protein